MNHPAIGVSPFLETPISMSMIEQHKVPSKSSPPESKVGATAPGSHDEA